MRTGGALLLTVVLISCALLPPSACRADEINDAAADGLRMRSC
jgi:hypothetical protein